MNVQKELSLEPSQQHPLLITKLHIPPSRPHMPNSFAANTPLPIESALTALINEITEEVTEPQSYVLVLDDCHLIEARPIYNALAFLLDHLPPQMHLVIATRSDPPLPLSRLRGRGQLTELRTADLRLTLDEVAAFLNKVMGLRLSAENIAALESHTEGWIVGLQMAAISIARHIPTMALASLSEAH